MASVDSRLRPSTDSWEEVPSYGQLYHELSNFMNFFVNNSRVLSFSTQYDHFTKHHRLDSIDVLLVVSLAVMWTCLRHLSTKHIFEPAGKHFKLTPSNQEKMPESAWKCFFYSAAWCLTFYCAVIKYGFFQRPSSVWDGWTLDSTVTFEIYLIYIVQTSFYLHSMYATMFVDIWRKDSLLLLFHHVVTFCLLAFSHAFRYNNIGILVLLFHDFCDIILEFTKVNVYFKVRGGKTFPIHEIIANIGFVLFTVTWYLTRLYWFPLKAIFTAASVPLAMNMGLVMPLLFTMNFLLWVVLSMDAYWFMMVLAFLYRVAIGQIKEIDDTREYDVEEKIKLKLKTNVKTETNGNSELAVNGHAKPSETNAKVQNGFCTNENSDVRVRKPTLKT